jgi:hypothetical protein
VVADGLVVVVEPVGGDEIVVGLDAVEVVVVEKVGVVPEFTDVVDVELATATVVVGWVTVPGCETCEIGAEATYTSWWACISASPPAAVVPSATEPATTATCEPATTTLPRLLN